MSTEIRVMIATLFGLATLNPVAAPEAQDFYRGKTVRLVVGYAPGGGYDSYARLVARHMGKHIPGNPAFISREYAGRRQPRVRQPSL